MPRNPCPAKARVDDLKIAAAVLQKTTHAA
jgi:pyruvate kinase